MKFQGNLCFPKSEEKFKCRKEDPKRGCSNHVTRHVRKSKRNNYRHVPVGWSKIARGVTETPGEKQGE